MAHLNHQIVELLETLRDVDLVEVTVGSKKGTVNIRCDRERSLDFKFYRLDDHFAGYFTDCDGAMSQAVISLWSPLDAIHFVTAYSLLVGLRAGRRNH